MDLWSRFLFLLNRVEVFSTDRTIHFYNGPVDETLEMEYVFLRAVQFYYLFIGLGIKPLLADDADELGVIVLLI